MIGTFVLAGALLLGSYAQAEAGDCSKHLGTRVAGGSSTLSFSSKPNPINVGAHFSLEMVACLKDGSAFAGNLKVDAIMPAHNHGMNYKPKITSLGAGTFRADGLMFHMPGHWRFRFELDIGSEREKFDVDYDVK